MFSQIAGLRVSIQSTVDTTKIQKLAEQASVEILVGYPSGREHVPTLHKNDYNKLNEKRRGKYVAYDGGSPLDQPPIETAELAKMLSYGTDKIPARPFLEEGIASKSAEIYKDFKEETEKVANGQPANWAKIGTKAVGAIQEFVRSDHYKRTVPNSQKTIKYKGSDTPLIDGADLINSTTFLVNGVER